MPRHLPYLFAAFITGLLLVGPAVYALHRHNQFRNVRVVRDGVLLRSAQLSLSGLQTLIHDYGIKTVVTLRDGTNPGEPPPDQAEERYCRDEEITYVRISPRQWWSSDGSVPASEGVRKFLDVMDDPANYPVLIHCYAGIHRTGAFCAVYRMEYEHWSNAQAITELRAGGYRDLGDEWDLLSFLETYMPRWRR